MKHQDSINIYEINDLLESFLAISRSLNPSKTAEAFLRLINHYFGIPFGAIWYQAPRQLSYQLIGKLPFANFHLPEITDPSPEVVQSEVLKMLKLQDEQHLEVQRLGKRTVLMLLHSPNIQSEHLRLAITALHHGLQNTWQHQQLGLQIQNLQKQAQETINAFEALPVAVAVLDKDMRYLAANAKWHEDYQLKGDIVGKSHYEIFPEIPPHWKAIHHRCLKEGIAEHCEAEKFIREDKSELWIRWDVKPWYNTQKTVQGLVMLTEVITKRRQKEEALRLSKLRAEEANQAKEQFLANISHEIRTPINAILGLSYLLNRQALDAPSQEYVQALRVSGEHLLAIINDVLDMSKIEAGKITLEHIGFRLKDLIEEVSYTLRYKAEEKGIGLFYELDRHIPPILIGDPVRLKQILLNLVNNAIKFTDKGLIEIECRLKENQGKEQLIQFKVIDTGKGIDPDKIEQIFESFVQEDNSINRHYGGTGLGLSISQKLVNLMGGNLQVRSRKSTGTTFFFEIYLSEGAEEHLPQSDKVEVQSLNLKGLKVLLVEDHDINQLLGKTLLEEQGIITTLAENGKEALLKVEQERFDLILMDIQMPVMNGEEASKIIRKQLKIDTPIIALTAHAIKGESEKYLNSGMNDYVNKPFEPEELYLKIAQHSNRQPKTPVVKPQSKAKVANTNRLYQITSLKKMLEGNEAMVERMLNIFVEKTPKLLEDLSHAYQEKDLESLASIAHKLKSSLDLMKIQSLYQDIRSLEKLARDRDYSPEIEHYLNRVRDISQQAISQIRKDFFEKD